MKLIPINPTRDLFNRAAIARAVRDTLRRTAEDAKADLEKTVATWQHQVAFAITPIPDGLLVATGDPIWRMVDEGTRPHIIVPRRAKVLVFGPGARAKTTPRVIGSTAGSPGGAPVVAHRVQHPGTTPRAFADTVQQKYDDELPRRMDAALREVLP